MNAPTHLLFMNIFGQEQRWTGRKQDVIDRLAERASSDGGMITVAYCCCCLGVNNADRSDGRTMFPRLFKTGPFIGPVGPGQTTKATFSSGSSQKGDNQIGFWNVEWIIKFDG